MYFRDLGYVAEGRAGFHKATFRPALPAAQVLLHVGKSLVAGVWMRKMIRRVGWSAGMLSPRRLFTPPMSRYTSALFFFGTLFGLAQISAPAGAAAEYFVAPHSDDKSDGSLAHPFASLERARDVIRAARTAPGARTEPGTITLRGGVYHRSTALELTGEDSGAPARSIVVRAYPGETVRIIGGRRLEPQWFEVVTENDAIWERLDPAARGKVERVELRSRGIVDFGELVPRGMQLSKHGALGLFVAGRALPLAQWPDAPEAAHRAMDRGFALIEEVLDAKTFRVPSGRASRWGQADQLWFHGYWGNAWADFHVASAAVNAGSQWVALAEAPRYPMLKGQPFRAYNLLEEITEPGEWFLDRKTGVLYVWPTQDWARAEILVSTSAAPLVSIHDARNVLIEGLSFELGWGSLLTVEGGAGNCIRRCQFLHAGANAVVVSGENNGLEGCLIADAGDRGVLLTGGSRPDLIPARNYIRHSRVVRFSRWSWTYAPGVELRGVGQIIANNELSDAPHSAILYSGNDHLIELNNIHNVCRFSSDAGAVYSGRNWGWRGTVIRHNFFHHIDSELEGYGTHGVYLDDLLSGNHVVGNLFYRVSGHAIQSGGGRDNIMENNIVVHCGDALSIDVRGPKSVSPEAGHKWNLLERLGDGGVDYRSERWSRAYPALARMPDNWEGLTAPGARWRWPEGCVFSRNIGFRNKVFIKWTDEDTGCRLEDVLQTHDNLEDVDPRFVDEASLNLALRDDSPAYQVPGFKRIPFERIGPDAAIVSSPSTSP